MKDGPLCVRRYDQGRFLVRSQRPPCENHYIVALDDPEYPHGHCTCDHFHFRIDWRVRQRLPLPWEDCIHIRTARAEIEYAQMLCEMAGLTYDVAIIPMA